MDQDYDEVDALFSELRDREVRMDDLARVESLLVKHPSSARLWDLCGDLVQLCDENKKWDRDDNRRVERARACYERAVQVDPDDYLAYESLGYWYEVFDDSLEKSAESFERAISLGDRDSSRIGLSRVLAQVGKRSDAVNTLKQCEFNSQVELLLHEISTGQWDPIAQE